MIPANDGGSRAPSMVKLLPATPWDNVVSTCAPAAHDPATGTNLCLSDRTRRWCH